MLFIFVFIALSCSAKKKIIPPEKLSVKEFNFDSFYSYHGQDSSTAYSLLSMWFPKELQDSYRDSLIRKWISNHPNAMLTPVYKRTLSKVVVYPLAGPAETLTYCWIIDGNDTLNNYLIKQGCMRYDNMQRPKTWEEMDDTDKKLFDEDNPFSMTVYVDQNSYDNFILQILDAEQYAKSKKLGIWAKPSMD